MLLYSICFCVLSRTNLYSTTFELDTVLFARKYNQHISSACIRRSRLNYLVQVAIDCDPGLLDVRIPEFRLLNQMSTAVINSLVNTLLFWRKLILHISMACIRRARRKYLVQIVLDCDPGMIGVRVPEFTYLYQLAIATISSLGKFARHE